MSPPRSGRHGIVAFKKVRKCENKCENKKKDQLVLASARVLQVHCGTLALEGAVQRGTHVVVW